MSAGATPSVGPILRSSPPFSFRLEEVVVCGVFSLSLRSSLAKTSNSDLSNNVLLAWRSDMGENERLSSLARTGELKYVHMQFERVFLDFHQLPSTDRLTRNRREDSGEEVPDILLWNPRNVR